MAASFSENFLPYNKLLGVIIQYNKNLEISKKEFGPMFRLSLELYEETREEIYF
jgi:hypothetical protein